MEQSRKQVKSFKMRRRLRNPGQALPETRRPLKPIVGHQSHTHPDSLSPTSSTSDRANCKHKSKHTMHPRAAHETARKLAAVTCCCATLLSLLLFLQLILHAQGQQYPRSPSVSAPSQAQNLVNAPQSYYANNLNGHPAFASPLMPSAAALQSFQQGDLDNVIESTTASSNVNVAAFAFNSRPFQQQQTAQTTCQLPPTWAGRWYQANKEPIRVTNTEISDKGVCRDNKGDKYLFEVAHLAHNSQASPCLICLVINERHLNVLQYKESSCQPIPAQFLNKTQNQNALIIDSDHKLLDSICSDITGDAQLESLFRLDTPPIECPIHGKFQFTYDNCREPQSSLDSCIDKKQLHFKFSACPDTPGSESKSEVLKCYADWSEGNNYYMIGRLDSASHQDKGKFRCFLYEKSADGYIQMAQSLEESCYGLINAAEGPKTLRLTARQPPSNRCQLPSYIQSQSENWLSVDNTLIYMFNQNSTKFQVKETKEGNVIEEATCLQQIAYPVHPHSMLASQARYQARSGGLGGGAQIQQQVTTPTSRRFSPSSNHFNQIDQSSQQLASSARLNDLVYLVQITKNCYTTDYCVRFHRRTSGIVQIDYFIALPGSDGQQRCRNAYMGTPQTQIITSTNLEQQRCPFEGVFSISTPAESEYSYNPSNIFVCPRSSQLMAQCEQPSHLRIQYQCSPSTPRIAQKNLYCLGSWTLANGLVRVILADDERQRYSAWYKDYGPLLASASGDSNDQDPSMATQMTRSQQLLGLSSLAGTVNPLVSTNQIIDLQMTLITALPTMSKTMQVRLTRQAHCSDLQRHYASLGSVASTSVPSYASPSAASGALASLAPARSFNVSQVASLAMLVIVTMLYTSTTNRHLLYAVTIAHQLPS